MSSRTKILNRIRTSLEKDAPHPHHPASTNVFPPIQHDHLVDRFEQEFKEVKGTFIRAKTWAEAQTWIKEFCVSNNFKKIVTTHADDCIRASSSVSALPISAESKEELGGTDMAITGCDYAIARTGSIALTTETGAGRILSILPPSHLVIVRRQQFVSDVSDAVELLKERHQSRWPSMVTFITGPSRTADIEKILVLGAHGPKSLSVLLLDF
jgi:L-lactate dehydrogenase complex protein LldG